MCKAKKRREVVNKNAEIQVAAAAAKAASSLVMTFYLLSSGKEKLASLGLFIGSSQRESL